MINIAPRKFLALVSLFHLLLWGSAAALLQKNGSHDVIEAIAWGGQWQLGYDRDPFLVAWLAHLAYWIGSASVWPIYYLSQLCVIASFWAVWRLAKIVGLDDFRALVAVLFLEGIYYYHFTTAEFNDNVLQIPLWAASSYFYYKSLTNQKIADWSLTGCFLALAMLAKYFTIMLMLPMFAILLCTKEGRSSFKSPGIYIGMLVGAVVLSPNLYWQYQNDWQYIHYALDRAEVAPSFLSHIKYPIRFALSQLMALTVPLILYFSLTKWQNNNRLLKSFSYQYILIMALGPFVTSILYSAFTGTLLRSMWGTPLFSLVGILLVMTFSPDVESKKRYLMSYLGFALAALVTYISLVTVSPYILGYAKNEFYPSQKIALDVDKLWLQHYHKPLEYVAGPRRLSARVAVYSKAQPIPYFEWSKATSPWVSEQDLQSKGAIFLWDTERYGDKLPLSIRRRYPSAITLAPRSYKWQTGAIVPPVVVGLAILPPQT